MENRSRLDQNRRNAHMARLARLTLLGRFAEQPGPGVLRVDQSRTISAEAARVMLEETLDESDGIPVITDEQLRAQPSS